MYLDVCLVLFGVRCHVYVCVVCVLLCVYCCVSYIVLRLFVVVVCVFMCCSCVV